MSVDILSMWQSLVMLVYHVMTFSCKSQHVHSMEIKGSDGAGIECKVRKGEIRFYFNHTGDGRYIFKVPSEGVRDAWISQLQSVIEVCNNQFMAVTSPKNMV